jgi:SHS2 domain-containing protein
MKKFEFFDHTSDVGIRAFGQNINEAFENAGLAVFEIMTDTSHVDPKINKDIEVEGFDLENLLYRWIEALLFYYDTELLLFSRFSVNIDLKNIKLSAKVSGEKFDENKHERRTLVKAMTYNEMEIKQNTDGSYTITFVVDI